MKFRRIVVGVDFSDNARRGLALAVGLAQGLGSEVIAVHALGLVTHLKEGAPPVPSEAHRDEIHQLFEQQWCGALQGADVPCRCLIVHGNPVSVLLDVADREDADLIVVGSRGVGGYPDLLLGSTSHQLAERSRWPVVIVPPKRRADQEMADELHIELG